MLLLVLPDYAAEDDLLAAARAGDRDAVITIYDRYFPPVYQFIRLRVSDAQLAEDLAADVFVELVTALRGSSPPRTSLRGWLFQVARNRLATQYRSARRLTETELDEWLPVSAADADAPTDPEAALLDTLTQADQRQAVRAALQTLTPDQQDVLLLRFGQQLSLQATADVLGKSVTAVKQLQLRAAAALRQRLRGKDWA